MRSRRGGMLPQQHRRRPVTSGMETRMASAIAPDRPSNPSPPSPSPLVAAEGVAKSYGPVKALDRIDLSVRAGEFVALLGLNGAGKTTLFQLLSGLFVPDAGSILINGADMRRNPVAGLSGLGIVFQDSTLDLDLPVSSSLYFHAGLHGLPRAAANVRMTEELTRLGLQDSANSIGRKLSGGNRRRVELVRALM